MTQPSNPSTQCGMSCFLCGEDHPLQRCPTLGKVLKDEKGKSVLKRILDAQQIMIRQICETSKDDTTEIVQEDSEENDSSEIEYETSNEGEDESDFHEAG